MGTAAFSLVGGLGCLGRKEAATSIAPQKTSPIQVKGTFIEGASAGDAETLNWILAADAASLNYVNFAMDGLAVYDNGLNMILRWLAEPIEVSKDGLAYTLTLRDDLYWSDGKQVAAEDFVYTYKNLMFSDWMPFNYKDDYREKVDGKKEFVDVKVVDKNTYQFIRQTVDPEFLYTVTDFWAYPKHVVKKYEGDLDAFTKAKDLNNLSYTGNLGPYRFVEWVRKDKLVLERNPDYYLGKNNGAPYFENYIVKILGTPAARHAALEAGDITSTTIDPLQVKRFKEMEHIKVYTTPTSGYTIQLWNFRDNGWKGFSSKRIRQALSMSISKDSLIQSIYLGFADPAYSFIPKPSPWFSDAGLSKYGAGELYSKQKAVKIFQEEGYGLKDGKILDKDGKPLKFTIITNSGNKVRESICFLIKQDLSDIGIEVEMKFLPWTTELNQYLRNKIPGSSQAPAFNNGPRAVSDRPWDMCVIGFGTDVLAPSGSSVFFSSTGGLNFWGYSNPKVDDLFGRVKTRESLDEARRKKIYGELSALLSEDLPGNFLAYPYTNTGFQKNVEGIEPGINMGYNYHEWFFA
jgi:peptide/nickel transport system substrate-binding protein